MGRRKTDGEKVDELEKPGAVLSTQIGTHVREIDKLTAARNASSRAARVPAGRRPTAFGPMPAVPAVPATGRRPRGPRPRPERRRTASGSSTRSPRR